MVEIVFPAGRVFAGAIAVDLGPAENALDSPAQPAGSFGLGHPDRLQHLHYEAEIDVLYWECADDWVRVCLDGVAPLLPVLGIAPDMLVGSDVASCRLCERDGLGFRDS